MSIWTGLTIPPAAVLNATARKTEYCLCPRCRKHEPVLESGLCERCDQVCAQAL